MLCTQKPGLKEVDLECCPKRGSDKISRPRKKKTIIVQPGLTDENPALREVDLELSAKRGTDRTKTLLSLLLIILELAFEIVVQQNLKQIKLAYLPAVLKS